MLRIQFVDELTSEYLNQLNQQNLTNGWHGGPAPVGVYISGYFFKDLITRRLVSAFKRYITNPYTIGFIALLGVANSKSWGPRDLTKSVVAEIISTFIGLLIFFIPALLLALMWDIFFTLPVIYWKYRFKLMKQLNDLKRQGLYDRQVKNDILPRINAIQNAFVLTHVTR